MHGMVRGVYCIETPGTSNKEVDLTLESVSEDLN